MKEKLRNEWNKLKEMNFSEKREYIWDYYKIQIVVSAVLLIFLGSIINFFFINPPKKTVLTVAWMGGPISDEQRQALIDYLEPALITDTDNQAITVETFTFVGDSQMDTGTMTLFTAMVMSADLDILIATPDLLEHYSKGNIFKNISEATTKAGFVLPAESDILTKESDNGETIPYAVALTDNLHSFGVTYENLYLSMLSSSKREAASVTALLELLYK